MCQPPPSMPIPCSGAAAGPGAAASPPPPPMMRHPRRRRSCGCWPGCGSAWKPKPGGCGCWAAAAPAASGASPSWPAAPCARCRFWAAAARSASAAACRSSARTSATPAPATGAAAGCGGTTERRQMGQFCWRSSQERRQCRWKQWLQPSFLLRPAQKAQGGAAQHQLLAAGCCSSAHPALLGRPASSLLSHIRSQPTPRIFNPPHVVIASRQMMHTAGSALTHPPTPQLTSQVPSRPGWSSPCSR